MGRGGGHLVKMERVGAGGGGIWLKWRELGRGHLVKMQRVGAGGGGESG